MEVFCFVLSGLNLTLVNNARKYLYLSRMCDGADPSYNKIRIQFVGDDKPSNGPFRSLLRHTVRLVQTNMALNLSGNFI